VAEASSRGGEPRGGEEAGRWGRGEEGTGEFWGSFLRVTVHTGHRDRAAGTEGRADLCVAGGWWCSSWVCGGVWVKLCGLWQWVHVCVCVCGWVGVGMC